MNTVIFDCTDELWDRLGEIPKVAERERELKHIRMCELERAMGCELEDFDNQWYIHGNTKPHHVFYVSEFGGDAGIRRLESFGWTVCEFEAKYALTDLVHRSKLENWLSKNGNKTAPFKPSNTVVFVHRRCTNNILIAFQNEDQARSFEDKFKQH